MLEQHEKIGSEDSFILGELGTATDQRYTCCQSALHLAVSSVTGFGALYIFGDIQEMESWKRNGLMIRVSALSSAPDTQAATEPLL